MTTIAILAMGEMGSGIARRLVERGAHVLTSLEGRSAASAERAGQAGVDAVDERELVDRADLFLSVIPPASAAALAERFLPLIEAAGRRPVFVDCNAVAPQTVKSIAGQFAKAGASFLDGSIIGPPPKADGSSPRLYLSGPLNGEAETLAGFGIDARALSSEIGDASALKMAYAGITKGFQALGSAMVLGAWRNGVGEHFVQELKGSQPQLHAWLTRELPRMYPKAYRWIGEMEEIGTFLQPERGSSAMLSGAARLYEHIAEDDRMGPNSEIIGSLNAFVRKS